MSCKIIDVDFKNKRKNFSFEIAQKTQEVKRVEDGLRAVLVDIKHICEDDKLYFDWVLGLFSNILTNLKGRI